MRFDGGCGGIYIMLMSLLTLGIYRLLQVCPSCYANMFTDVNQNAKSICFSSFHTPLSIYLSSFQRHLNVDELSHQIKPHDQSPNQPKTVRKNYLTLRGHAHKHKTLRVGRAQVFYLSGVRVEGRFYVKCEDLKAKTGLSLTK